MSFWSTRITLASIRKILCHHRLQPLFFLHIRREKLGATTLLERTYYVTSFKWDAACKWKVTKASPRSRITSDISTSFDTYIDWYTDTNLLERDVKIITMAWKWVCARSTKVSLQRITWFDSAASSRHPCSCSINPKVCRQSKTTRAHWEIANQIPSQADYLNNRRDQGQRLASKLHTRLDY